MSVSVPYRGATFLNLVHIKNCRLIVNTVSVPYRGATFLNQAGVDNAPNEKASFRPLSGSYISQ